MDSYNVCEKTLISSDEIKKRVSELGCQISHDYKDKEVIFISVLNGSFMFTSDLMKEIHTLCSVDFIQISTYGNSTQSSGDFILKKDLSMNIEGKDIIIIEDIIDSGFTLSNLVEFLKSKNPASIKIAAFIDKPAKRKTKVKADYVGFVINHDYFIVGYGLDFSQKYRNLPYVGILKEHLHS